MSDPGDAPGAGTGVPAGLAACREILARVGSRRDEERRARPDPVVVRPEVDEAAMLAEQLADLRRQEQVLAAAITRVQARLEELAPPAVPGEPELDRAAGFGPEPRDGQEASLQPLGEVLGRVVADAQAGPVPDSGAAGDGTSGP